MNYLRNTFFSIYKGMRFLPFSIVLFLFCGCNNQPQFITESLQETEAMLETQHSDPSVSDETEVLYVYVCGAVKNPGVYPLPTGARVYEAVEAAGGFQEDAGQVAVNLAQMLSDGQQVYIPTAEEEEVIVRQEEEKQAGLININTADSDKLQELPGIGKSRADAIILYRENNGLFQSIEDIMNVSGIKSSVFERIKEYITV